ncbi:MAG: DUF3108 domain-containing protein [Candidatus Marinimicrobia bacterium]|nr:DUF3108 domain-containing protein [Candidatus Neomarinimicrobiota bacterium]
MKYFLSFILFVTISKCQEIPFKVGELLIYTAQFELIPVGEAELFFKGNEKFNDIDVYHVSWKAYTKGLASTIFKIQDKIDIWIDKKDFFTHRLKKNINEGSYSKKVDVKFDYDKSIAKTETKEIPIDFKARDPFSMFYYLRTINLEKDVVMNFSAFEGKRIIDYSLQMTGSEIIKSPLGEFKCKIVKPFRDGKNLFKNSGDMRIWISNDKQRLPVKIQIKMKVGTMTLLLKEIN